jgi:histidinol-phosphate aminotransferase
VGLLDYYRQFTSMTPEEVNEQLHARATERKQRELARVEPVDLSTTTWHELPHPNVVAAITFIARRGLNTYADRRAAELRTELANLVGVPPDRIAIGTGAAQLLQSAAHELMETGDELVTPWPSYGLYPIMARRAHGSAVPVPGFSVDALLSAVNERTRLVCVCNPNDPTGELLDAAELERLLAGLPERAVVLLDEALVDFVGAQGRDAALALLDDHPRLLVFRSFSKAWGLAGLRCGYALGGPGAEPLLERLTPDVAVNDLTQAGALEALRSDHDRVARRSAAVAAERERVAAALRDRGHEVAPSHANVLWVAVPGRDGGDVAEALARAGVIVAAGGPLGDADRVRITIRGPEATVRLLNALDQVL